MSMNRPDRKSFTIDWAPKPRATPPMPAPAISGPRFTPISPITISAANVHTVNTTMLRRTCPSVSARDSARTRATSSISILPGPRSRNLCRREWLDAEAMRLVNRTMARLANRVAIHANTRMSAMRIGRSSVQSAAVARPPFSVQS